MVSMWRFSSLVIMPSLMAALIPASKIAFGARY